MSNALTLYIDKYNDYPADESRNVPAGVKEFLTSKEIGDGWPDAPYPGSVYDYDNWVDPDDGSQIIQISVRFCPASGPTTACAFPNEPWINSGTTIAHFTSASRVNVVHTSANLFRIRGSVLIVCKSIILPKQPTSTTLLN
jgi:hypothetical protein